MALKVNGNNVTAVKVNDINVDVVKVDNSVVWQLAPPGTWTAAWTGAAVFFDETQVNYDYPESYETSHNYGNVGASKFANKPIQVDARWESVLDYDASTYISNSLFAEKNVFNGNTNLPWNSNTLGTGASTLKPMIISGNNLMQTATLSSETDYYGQGNLAYDRFIVTAIYYYTLF